MTNVTAALDALGDPTRRAIFERLAERPRAGRRAGPGAPGQPPRRLAAPQGAQGRAGWCVDAAARHPPHLPARPGRGRAPARLPRPVLEPSPGRRSRRPSNNTTKETMSMQAARPRCEPRSSSRRRSSARSRCSPTASARWWPPEHHIAQPSSPRWSSSPASAGTATTAASTAANADWARVLALRAAAPRRVQLGHRPRWQLETDPDARARSSPLRRRGRATARGSSSSTATSSATATAGQPMRDAVGSPEGWAGLLKRFAGTVAER